MLSVLSHIELTTAEPNTDWQNISKDLQASNLSKDIKGIAPFVQGQAMLLQNGNMYGIGIRGIEPNYENNVSNIMKSVKEGNKYINFQEVAKSMNAGSFNILIGKPLANHLGVTIGDKVTLAVANSNVTPLGVTPRLKSVSIAGILDTGHYEFDSSLIIMHIQDAKALLMLEDISGMRLKLNNMYDAPFIAQDIQAKFQNISAKDWGQQNKTWFSAVQTEKRMMFIILSLMVAVAAFNLVSTLVMSVKDKQGNIAIMRTFGATANSIRRIFIYQGLIIGIGGTLLGLFLGCLVAYNVGSLVSFIENVFNTKFLPESIYLISSMPSDPRFSDISTIIFGSMFMTILATIYPSHRASKLYPADVLRHE
jgi:lipoprotein-releasing system permease protein